MNTFRPSATAVLAALLCSVGTTAMATDRGAGHGILSQLPADAPPGDCYARVKVKTGPSGPPPVSYGATWVQTPGPPGSPGPIWCLVPTGPHPVQAPPIVTKEGWVRVVCDRDITPDRVRDLQRRLHDRGLYRGEFNGAYDRDTAAAVEQFQQRSRIDHGGYLSLETWDALNGPAPQRPPAHFEHQQQYAQAGPAAPLSPPPIARHGDERQGGFEGYRYESDGAGSQRYYSHQSYSRQSYAGDPGWAGYGSSAYGFGYGAQGSDFTPQGGYPPEYYGQQGYQQPQPYPPQGSGWRPPYAAIGAGSAVQNGYLVWGGKTRY
jgi:hypothetical protein